MRKLAEDERQQTQELRTQNLATEARLTEANRKLEEARQSTLTLLQLNLPRIVPTANNAEGGDNSYLDGLKKFAGMQVIIESSGGEAQDAAESIEDALRIAEWKVIDPLPRSKKRITPGVFVESYLASTPPTQADWQVIGDEKTSRDAASALMRLLGGLKWEGIGSNFDGRITPIPDALPPNTVRVLVGSRPPANFLHPLVIKWRNDFQQVLEKMAVEKARSAAGGPDAPKQ